MEIDDRQLEEALAGYSKRDPRPGVEQRILAQVARVTARRSRLRWMLAAACIVGIAAIVAIPRRESTPIPRPAPKSVAVAAPAPPVTVRPERPRRDRFPTPAPLTSEERAWLALSDTGVVASLQSEDIEPIRIEELTIPPIGSEGGE